jgi:hypothetical protein
VLSRELSRLDTRYQITHVLSRHFESLGTADKIAVELIAGTHWAIARHAPNS